MANSLFNRRHFMASVLFSSVTTLALAKQQSFHKPWISIDDLTNISQELHLESNIPETWTIRQLSKARHLEQIKQYMLPNKQPGKKNWQNYLKIAVAKKHIVSGNYFYKKHKKIFNQAQQLFNVDAWPILGILGIETNFGKTTGKFKTLDSLSTLAFDFPIQHPRHIARQFFFRSELKALLRLAYSQSIDLEQTRGSFAGAIGWAQFMPSSVEKYAISTNQNGIINLFNPADAIYSIANYLKQFGWQQKMPSFYYTNTNAVHKDDWKILLEKDIVPSFTQHQLSKLGVKLTNTKTNHQGLLAMIKLENTDDAPTYLAGSENFYCITRYNKSSYYAAAVSLLGEKILLDKYS